MEKQSEENYGPEQMKVDCEDENPDENPDNNHGNKEYANTQQLESEIVFMKTKP